MKQLIVYPKKLMKKLIHSTVNHVTPQDCKITPLVFVDQWSSFEFSLFLEIRAPSVALAKDILATRIFCGSRFQRLFVNSVKNFFVLN